MQENSKHGINYMYVNLYINNTGTIGSQNN